MSDVPRWLLVLGFMAVVGLVSAWLWWLAGRTYAGKDGERRLRTRMQGPFVPLRAEDIAEDEARIAQRRSGRLDGQP